MISMRMSLAFALAVGTLPVCGAAEASVKKPTRAGSLLGLQGGKPLTGSKGRYTKQIRWDHKWNGWGHGHNGHSDCQYGRSRQGKGGKHGQGHGNHCPVSPG